LIGCLILILGQLTVSICKLHGLHNPRTENTSKNGKAESSGGLDVNTNMFLKDVKLHQENEGGENKVKIVTVRNHITACPAQCQKVTFQF